MDIKPPLYDHHFFTPQPEIDPTFIVGMGRSGTTMLRLMLHRHSELAMLSETWFFPRVWERRWSHPMREPAEPFRRRLLDTFIGLLQKNDDFPIDFEIYRKAVQGGDASLARFLSELGSLWAERENANRWGEKTPIHIEYLDVLAKMFPSAHVLHIVRDPRDVAASLVEAPFNQCNNPVTFALDWLRTVETEEHFSRTTECASDRLLRVRYEDLVTSAEETLSHICAHIDVTYEEAMIEFQKAAEAYAPDQPWMDKLHQPISNGSIGRWRRDLDPDDVVAIEALCRHRMQEMGYEPASGTHEQRNSALASRIMEAQKAWESERDRMKTDHISMHRGDYRRMIETISNERSRAQHESLSSWPENGGD